MISLSRNTKCRVVLIAPNVSESMGGEAIKAYQFFIELSKVVDGVSLITHARCQAHVAHLEKDHEIHYVNDDLAMKFFWEVRFFRFLVTPYFFFRVRSNIRNVVPTGRSAVVHYVSPISPMLPRFPMRQYTNIIGPLNGNIRYPSAFRSRESFKKRLSYYFLDKIAFVSKYLFNEECKYKQILVSGYGRTHVLLQKRGFLQEQMTNVVDSGISDEFFDQPRVVHIEKNGRFVFIGRLVDVKGLDLAILSLAKTAEDVTLDVIGDGEHAKAWMELVEQLGIVDRVTFMGWKPHGSIMQELRKYRGLILPSLAEANGIVVQEAMAVGVPVIALNWGGPAQLLDHDTGILVDPDSVEAVTDGLSSAMMRLYEDPTEAERLSKNAWSAARKNFSWASVVSKWTEQYFNH